MKAIVRTRMVGMAALVGAIILAAAAGVISCKGEDGKDGSAGAAGAAGTGGATGAAGADGAALHWLDFSPVTVSTTDAAKRLLQASDLMTVDGTTTPVGFHTILRSGDQPGTSPKPWGQVVDKNGAAVTLNFFSGQPFTPTTSNISHYTDFSSLLVVKSSGQADKLFNVSHFEETPGGMYVTQIAQDPTTGVLTASRTDPIDFSGVFGLIRPCAGSVTPWQTHLGSEESDPDGRAWEAAIAADGDGSPVYNSSNSSIAFFAPMAAYFGVDYTTAADSAIKAVMNPYSYGYAVEVSVNYSGTPTVTKHWTMGRMTLELAKVMPDQKTVYLTDDVGDAAGFFMFVADIAGNLASGRLFAAKWNQLNATNGGSADLEWIPMDSGSVTDAQVYTALNAVNGVPTVKFSDIFTIGTTGAGDANADGSCTAQGTTNGYKTIHVNNSGSAAAECLKLNTGKEVAAARLETRRYAAYLGATTEFQKEEGIALDESRRKLYVAMSRIRSGMLTANAWDLGGPDHIQLGTTSNDCGAIYELDLGPVASVGGSGVASEWVAKNMKGLVVGTPATYTGTYAGNTCDLAGIAEPDNLTFIPGYNTLIIGEDTGKHQNDALWSYNFATAQLTRIMTTPYGAEATSAYYYDDINGFGYLVSVVQHPYGESDQAKWQAQGDERSYFGYIGPFPALK